MKTRPHLLRLLALCACLLGPGLARAQLFCVFDPLGAGGDYYRMFKDYQLAAKRWSVSIDLKPYTDDNQLDADFKSGACDMASMIGQRARLYNTFTGTLDAPSVIENYAQEREAMAVVASPKAATYMTNNGIEVVGVVPIGAAYVVSSDRYINSFDHAVGKKVAIMAWDPVQAMMAKDFKTVPVPVQLPQFGDYFNKGKVDFIVAPIAIYKALELSKGIGSKGGIVRRPLFQFSMQVLDHADKFPEGFGQKSREYMFGQTDHALSLAHNQEAEVDSKVWMYALHQEIIKWDNTMRTLLKHLTKEGLYDRHMLAVLQRIRCKTDTDDPECTAEPAQ